MKWQWIVSCVFYLDLLRLGFTNAQISKFFASSVSCPVPEAKNGDPEPCNGKSRPYKSPVFDDRQVYNMTGRDALQIIGQVSKHKANCTTGGDELSFPTLSIRYESTIAFRKQAEQAVRLANQMSYLLTRGYCGAEGSRSMIDFGSNIEYLYSLARNTFEVDVDVVGAGIIFRRNAIKGKEYFAPYSLRLGNGTYFDVRDRSTKMTEDQKKYLEYLEKMSKNRTYLCLTSVFSPRKNQSADKNDIKFIQPYIEYIDGSWGRPYFECLSAKIWLVPYAVPFFRIATNTSSDKNFLEFM